MDREEHNIYGAPRIAPKVAFEESDRKLLKHPPVLLDGSKRAIVETAIREFAAYKKTTLHALNVRTNHVHIVIAASDKPERLMTSIKAYSTRRLRETGLVAADARVWSRHGSTKWIWDDDQIADACEYVLMRQ